MTDREIKRLKKALANVVSKAAALLRSAPLEAQTEAQTDEAER